MLTVLFQRILIKDLFMSTLAWFKKFIQAILQFLRSIWVLPTAMTSNTSSPTSGVRNSQCRRRTQNSPGTSSRRYSLTLLRPGEFKRPYSLFIENATNILKVLPFSFLCFSVPTPQITDNIDVAWAPLAPNKNRVYRIGSKLSLENDFKKDILKWVRRTLIKIQIS